MDNAKLIFQQFANGSIDYIRQNILNKPLEDTWIECKSKSDPTHPKLDEKDKSNFAKNLSGFANTSGGVLIFGLKATKNSEGFDIVTEEQPIKDLDLFEAALREQEPHIVERAISEIEYKGVYTDEDKTEGILLVYIPESTNPPHRSLKDKHFYLRAGGSCYPMDLPQIESLVLKNIKPELEIDFFIFTNMNILTPTQDSNIEFNMDFQIKNIGRAMAKNIFIRLEFPRDIALIYEISPAKKNIYDKVITETKDVVYDWHYDKPIHPNICVPVKEAAFLISLRQQISPGSHLPPFLFYVSVCAENMALKSKNFNKNGQEMLNLLMDPGIKKKLI
jgi:hypothetical protein